MGITEYFYYITGHLEILWIDIYGDDGDYNAANKLYRFLSDRMKVRLIINHIDCNSFSKVFKQRKLVKVERRGQVIITSNL